MTLHPQIIEKQGKKEFVVLPYDEFLKIEEILEDFEDLRDLRKAKAVSKNDPPLPLERVKKDLGI